MYIHEVDVSFTAFINIIVVFKIVYINMRSVRIYPSATTFPLFFQYLAKVWAIIEVG